MISAFNTFLYFLLFLFLIGWLVPSERNKRMKEIDKQIRASLMGMIKNREKAMKAEEAGNDDFAY